MGAFARCGEIAAGVPAAPEGGSGVRRIPDVDPAGAIPDLLHKVRNPLAALKAGISLVSHVARPTGEAVELLDQMLHEVDRLDATTRDTQRYLRLDAGRPAKVAVAVAAGEARAAAAQEAARAGVEIALAGSAETTVRIDRDELRFALGELIANGCRHSPPGGRVRVSWRRRAKGSVAIAVSDACGGIPASYAGEVGRPYFTTSPERTGLGLATVARACRLAGGSLRWGGVAGVGCRFTMELPNG